MTPSESLFFSGEGDLATSSTLCGKTQNTTLPQQFEVKLSYTKVCNPHSSQVPSTTLFPTNGIIMFRLVLLLAVVLATALLLGFAHGFHSPSVSPTSSRSNIIYPARHVQGAHFHHRKSPLISTRHASTSPSPLKMSSDGSSNEESKALISPDGTFYDDEVDSAPKKEGISDSMRERLMREASTGLDADKKNTNVLLYIILGVAVLVVIGGAGVFY
jgi:hypothetical protein